jgi:DNA-binding IclR family transcriptional regulator
MSEAVTSRGVKSADRTVQVLELLASRPTRMTLSEVQRELGVPKSSLYGLMQTLVSRGWLETSDNGALYGIGLRALRVGTAYLERDPVVESAGPLLAQLRTRLDETVHLARLDGADIVYLASRESAHHLRSSSRIGRRLPAHATALGKVLIAGLTDDEVRELLPPRLIALTPETVTTMPELLAELADIRVQGHSFESGQNTPGLSCIAVSIPTGHGPSDAISCSVPSVRLTDEHHAQIVAALTHAADELGFVARRSR